MKDEKLRTPPEPLELKKQILNTRAQFRSNFGTSDIDVDSMAVWFGNAFPKYIWNEWKAQLKEMGLTWPRFLKLLKYNTKFMIDWVNGNISWEDFVQSMNKSVDNWIDKDIEMAAEALYKCGISCTNKNENPPWIDLDPQKKELFRKSAIGLVYSRHK